MTTISQINEMKQANLRCYYIDSDGDEVIVSDEEDYEVALEYAKAKGDNTVKFGLFKNENDDELEPLDNQINSKISFKNVAETVSVGEDEDINDVFSGDESDEIEEIEEIDSHHDLQYRLNSNIKETVSRESSIYAPSEISELAEKEDKLLKEAHESTGELEVQKKMSESSINSQSLMDQFDIVQSRVQPYEPKVPLQNDIEEIKEAINETSQEAQLINQPNSEFHQESDEKLEEISVSLEAQDDLSPKMSKEEEELFEMNSSIDQSQQVDHSAVAKEIINKAVEINDEQPKAEVQEIVENEFEHELIEEEKEFQEDQRQSVSVSVAQASMVKTDKKKINYFKRALDNLEFIFNNPHKKAQIAEIDECNEEKSQDYVVTCKPGKMTKRRWRIVNNSNICWPKRVDIVCETEGTDAQVPKISKPLTPGQKIDISINIKIGEDESENTVKVFVFRFYSKIWGYFGQPLVATVEVTPDVCKSAFKELSQVEKLRELMEGQDEVNPIMYEIANDFVEEGLGNFDQCIDAILQSKTNYEEAKENLLKNKAD
jgi:hypothetical protein